MVGMFDLVGRHLPFDHARVGAGASGWEEFVQDFSGDAVVGIGEGLRGKNPGGWLWFAARPGEIG